MSRSIINLFFEEPSREFNVREVARIMKISPTTSSKKLMGLVKKKILKYRKERIYHLFKSDLEAEEYKDLKRDYNIKKIRGSGLIEELNKFYLKPTIILFGSLSRGDDIEISDLDLVVISENNKDFPYRDKFEKKLKKEIQIFVVKNLKGLRNKYLMDNVLNGIVLQGKLKWN